MYVLAILIKSFSAALVAFGVAHTLLPLLIKAAHALSFFDRPDIHLKQHKVATPYLGGLAVYMGCLTGIALLFPVSYNIWFLIVGITMLLFLGLIDDLVVLRPSQKWWGQVVASCCMVRGGFYSKELFLYAYIPSLIPYLWPLVSMGWMLTIINAFNLIDVMDGLTAVTALSIAIALFMAAFTVAAYPVMILLAALIGALIAFFIWNKPVAKIYLGDSGALCIGGFLAVIPFMIPWGTHQKMGLFAPLMIFFVPLAEVALLIIIRTWRGIPFYQGSPDHFSHYLQRRGWSIYQILGLVLFVTGINSLYALLFIMGHISCTWLCVQFLSAVAFWLLVILYPYSVRNSIGQRS